jgi:hypothetical protein
MLAKQDASLTALQSAGRELTFCLYVALKILQASR